MSRKYDVKICKCGRIHFIDWNEISTACDKEKNLLLICGGCGEATYIGSDKQPDWFDENKICHMMYSYSQNKYEDFSINEDSFKSTRYDKGLYKVIYSHGIKVMMKTGYYATAYDNGIFTDMQYPDMWHIQRNDITVNEIKEFFNKWEEKMKTVNMNSLLKKLTDEQANELSSYMIEGLDWTGTKYERKV